MESPDQTSPADELASRVRFVILFEGRTGSSHLTDLLDSHPQVRSKGEGLGYIYRTGGSAEKQLEWTEWALRFPRHPKLGARSQSLRAVGFKTKLRVIRDPEAFGGILQALEVDLFRMARKNVVKAAVSAINGQRLRLLTGRTESNLIDDMEPLAPLVIKPEDLERQIRARQKYEADLDDFISNLHLRTHRIYYEDLLENQTGVLERVFSILKVEPAPLTSRFRKGTSDDLRIALGNFDEIAEAFRGSQYETMLYETS